MVGFKSCSIESFTASSLPPQLRGLILTDNELAKLPDDIGNLKHLEKLMLAGNYLSELPQSILGCEALELLRIAVNNFEVLPEWMLELPNLAWYVDAGNPGSVRRPVSSSHLPTVAWSNLDIQEKIGESSKNTVYKAHVNGQDVAVKLYGLGVTTDGITENEIEASVAAGTHPNLVSVSGIVSGTPDNREGVIMPLISPTYKPLGWPPDFSTLTRDVYPGGTVFTNEFVQKVLTSIADAVRHLHTQGVMHGDIYAHNILADTSGNCYLGDFGAASLFTPAQGQLRKNAESRALQHLKEELTSRIA
jgi:hypothetical protein